MGLFSKTYDYNLILEQVLDQKRFSANIKSLLLSMLYKIETSYPDYSKVKQIKKTKDEFLIEIINIIREYFDLVKTVEPESKEARILKEHNVLAVTNERERSILAYPTENAMLYAVSDIEPKYFYIEDFIFKKEFQQLLVDGANLNILEILEDFNGWSWNSKSIVSRGMIANVIYQNLIILFGLEYMDNCKNSSTKQYDIAQTLEKCCNEYYNKLIDVIYLKFKNEYLENDLKNKLKELKKYQGNSDDIKQKIDLLKKKNEQINKLLCNEKKLQKSLEMKNSQLAAVNKKLSLEKYKNLLQKEINDNIKKINELSNIPNSKDIEFQLNEYQRLLNLNISLEDAVIKLQEEFIKILDKKAKKAKTREEFMDVIYKIRYYRNIYILKDKAIKDYRILENNLKKILKQVVTFGSKNAYIKMCSLDIDLNANILVSALDSNAMELEDLKIIIDPTENMIWIDIFDNETFEKRVHVKLKSNNLELAVRKKKKIKIFM